MTLSSRDRIPSLILYAGISCIIVWSGIKMINYSLVYSFANDYLLQWEVTLHSFNHAKGKWPEFDGTKHIEYMENIIKQMENTCIKTPESNTARQYIYRINRITQQNENIFLLCFTDRIIIYGMSEKTFYKTDTYIDTKADPARGNFTGTLMPGSNTFTGVWKI